MKEGIPENYIPTIRENYAVICVLFANDSNLANRSIVIENVHRRTSRLP
jgi:hypothetical protein